MQPSLARALEDLHSHLAELIIQLDEPALRWQPVPGVGPVADLIEQAVALERWWIAGVAAGISSLEADCSGGDERLDLSVHLLHQLGCTGQISQTILASLSSSEWASERAVAGEATTVAGCVANVLTELARAMGQIQLICRLWQASRTKETTL
jgi:hypothetical protein